MSERAKIVRLPGDEFALHTPFDADFVELLKKLPSRDRRWDGIDGAWFVHDRHEAHVTQLCVAHFGSVAIFGEKGELDEIIDRAGRAVQERLL